MGINLKLSSSANGTRNNPVNSKNLVTDFGAVGDAQAVQGVTITSSGTGNRDLAFSSGNFTGADVGKAFSIWATPFNPNNFQTTIAAVTDTTHITVSSNLTSALSSAVSNIVWGTDNTNAFTGVSGWRAWAQTQTNPASPPVLLVPDGFYAWKANQAAGSTLHYLCGNNPKVRGISGNADACGLYQLNAGEMRFGTDPAIVANRGLTNSGGNSVRLLSASQGATSIFLADPLGTDLGGSTYGSRVVTNRAALITCYDMQGQYNSFQGYPPNNLFCEWNTIVGYNSGTGEVSLASPLAQDYKDTYPEFGLRNTTFGSDQGGPATMWVAPDGYDTTVTLENMTLYCTNNQMGAAIRNVVLNNIKCVGPGLYPSVNDNFTATNCVYPSTLEVDKMVNNVTWNGCTIRGLQQQSASPNKCTINGGTVDKMEAGRFLEMNNVAFTNEASLILGASSYGRTDRAIINNCTGIASIGGSGVKTDDLDGQAIRTNASDFYTFVSGVIKVLKSENTSVGNAGQANVLRGLAPGTWVTFDDKMFDQIVDVYEDGTYFYVQFANTTSWPFTVTRIHVHPCPDLTVITSTGTAPELQDLNAMTAREPMYSYARRTYTETLATNNTIQPTLWGLLTDTAAMSVNVTTAYTGVSALTWRPTQFANQVRVLRSGSVTTMDLTINAKIVGNRVYNGATQTWSGGQSGDTLPAFQAGDRLIGTFVSAPCLSANVNGQGLGPVIVYEVKADQGI